MNRTELIQHYKEFHGLEELFDEDDQLQIDWVQALIEDKKLVKNNAVLPLVSQRSELLKACAGIDADASENTLPIQNVNVSAFLFKIKDTTYELIDARNYNEAVTKLELLFPDTYWEYLTEFRHSR